MAEASEASSGGRDHCYIKHQFTHFTFSKHLMTFSTNPCSRPPHSINLAGTYACTRISEIPPLVGNMGIDDPPYVGTWIILPPFLGTFLRNLPL
jgi:hypothetical protein